MNSTFVRIPVDVLTSSVRSLLNASRFTEAATLLGPASGAPDEAALAVAAGEVTVATDWHHSRVTDADALRDNAPDGRRRGWAEFYLGLIADNVFGERADSPARFAEALRAGAEHADDYPTFEALRHLSDHDHDAEDHELTRQRWERSAFHAARAGLVGGTLAQLLLVAVSARDRGDEAGAALLATEVARWADVVGRDSVRDMAETFIDGEDPTKEPEDD